MIALREQLVTQTTQLEERSQLLENMRKENQNCSSNLENINNKIVEKLDVLEKQRESCPKHLTNLVEIQESIKQLNAELSGLRNENQKLVQGRDIWLNEIKAEFLKMKESQILSANEPRVSHSPAPKVIRGRESFGRVTYENRRMNPSPMVYRTERVVVSWRSSGWANQIRRRSPSIDEYWFHH